jgi:hypothetical protein
MKNRTESLQERKARIISNVVIAVLTIAGAFYCLKGAIMQITANWKF